MKHGPMSWHCLDIVFDLLLTITCCQYVLPFCCLAGADCLILLARGNTKLAKFTQSRSTTVRLFNFAILCSFHLYSWIRLILANQPMWGDPPKLWRPAMWTIVNHNLTHISIFHNGRTFPLACYLNNQVGVMEVLGLTNSTEDDT